MRQRHPLVRVGCNRCGWRGRRVYDMDNMCECEYPCSHSVYGHCPRPNCGGTVNPAWMISEASRKWWERKERKPTIVCLCGSTRFSKAFQEANLRETLAGRIVLTIGCDMRSDAEIFGGMSEDELTEIKRQLDDLHKRKIDLADEVLILNVGGYIGASTRSELEYARQHGKRVRWLEPERSVE